MIVLTQGFGTSQVPLWGFGDRFTHDRNQTPFQPNVSYWAGRRWGTFYWGDSVITWKTNESKSSYAFATEGKPSATLTLEGKPSSTLTTEGKPVT